MRLGIFGGSFDPVHIGHCWVAEAAIETLQLDAVHWIPAATNPLKLGGPIASDEDRLAMLNLAIGGSERHVVDDREIRRGQLSYTVDTVGQFCDENPGAEIIFIIGSDSLATIRQWHQTEKLLRVATPAVVQRGGHPEVDFSVLEGLIDRPRIEHVRQHVIVMPVIELSSSELRSRLARNRSIRFRTPRAVEALIDAKKLYR
jgi:nicotinate-nucleotide adenylyltransferase